MFINNIPVKIIKDKKFKTVGVKIIFYNDFNETNSTSYTLLTRLMTSLTKKYNTNEKMQKITGYLYGTGISMSSSGLYKTRATNVSMSFINPKYILNDNNLYDDCFDFLNEFLFRPNVKNKAFDEKVFNEEKSILKNDIINSFNNKKTYALRQAINHMCKDEIAKVSSFGSLEEIDKITPKSLYDTYLDLINNSKKYVFIYGDVEDSIIDKLSFLKKMKSQDHILDFDLKEDKLVEEVKEIKEDGNVNQAALVMGYRTYTNIFNPDFRAYQIFDMMLAGSAISTLHQVIREKHNLCYSIYTSNFHYNKIMFIRAGIDKNNYKKTVELIEEELEKYKNGIIDTDLLNIVKQDAINQYIDITDYPNELINLRLRKDVLNLENDPEKIMQEIKNVTKEDIVKIANKIKLDTIYMLS